MVARIIAAALQQSTGKTFIVENIGGAGGNIGMGYAARSDADGYTILLATNAYSVNASLYNKMPYDPLKDFVGVSELATSPNTFVVKSESAGEDDEGIRRARAGQSGQVQLRDAADRHHAANPARGAQAPREPAEARGRRVQGRRRRASQALLSGTVQLSSGSLPPAAPHIKAGTLRCLAVTGETRWPDLPDVPTMAGGRLQGLRVRDRHRAAGAGQDAAGGRRSGWRRKRSRSSARRT